MLPNLSQHTQSTSSDQFDIRNYIDSLTPTKTKGKYICPVCGGNDLSIDDNTGKYQCWHGCDCADIREAIAPWDEVKGQRRQPTKIIPHRKKPSAEPVPLPETIQPATLPAPIAPSKKVQKGNKVTTRYKYSPTQWIEKVEFFDTEGNRSDKQFYYKHLTEDCEVKHGKGTQPWTAYRLPEALEHCQGKAVILVEGEQDADSLCHLGLVAISLRKDSEINQIIQQLQQAGAVGLLTLTDHDDTGRKKAEKYQKAANQENFPCLTLSLKDMWENVPEKGDITDFLLAHPDMTLENFIRRLEYSIHQAVEARSRIEKQKPQQINQRERLKLEILAYAQESDPFEKAIAKSRICQQYRINARDLESLAAASQSITSTPKGRLISAKDIFDMENQGLKWLIPGILPAAGVTLLGGNPGSGKTTLAYDCAASIIYGDAFLGETPASMGKVLFVSSDEPLAFSQDKLINRGITDNFEFLVDWDVSQWQMLEEAIEELRPTLIVIDSFASIHCDPSFDENSSTAKTTIYRLNRLFQSYNTTGILIHHLNKSKDNKGVNRLRGSTAIAAASSMIWLLEGDGDTKHFTQPKTRGTEPLHLGVQLDPESGHFSVVSGQTDNAETKSVSKQLIDLFTSKPPGTRLGLVEIKNELPGVAHESLYKALNRLVKRGILIKRPSKVDKRQKVWGLPLTDNIQDSKSPTPPIELDKTVQEYPETHAEKEIELLDTSSTDNGQDIGQQNDQNPETHAEKEIELLDTPPPDIGGVGMSNENVNESDSQEASAIPELEQKQDAIEGFDIIDSLARQNRMIKKLGWTKEQKRNFYLDNWGQPTPQYFSDSKFIEAEAKLEALVNAQPSKFNEIDYTTFPNSSTNHPKTLKNQALMLKEAMLNAPDVNTLEALRLENGGKWSQQQIRWVWEHLNTQERSAILEISEIEQLNLFS